MNLKRLSSPHRLAALAACLAALGACSGSGSEPGAAARASSVPAVVAASAPTPASAPAAGQPAGSVPAVAVEGRPAAATPPSGAAMSADPTVELHREILRLVGTASCRSDDQCRVLPLGSKPCGGPESYLAWSTEGTDARALESLAARYAQARRARNQRLGLVSDCAIVPEPAVRCVPAAGNAAAGRCQTQSSRTGPAPVTR